MRSYPMCGNPNTDLGLVCILAKTHPGWHQSGDGTMWGRETEVCDVSGSKALGIVEHETIHCVLDKGHGSVYHAARFGERWHVWEET